MFKVKTSSGTYKVRMRASYANTVRSEKAYRNLLQKTIDRYRAIGQVAVADSLQSKLDNNKLHDLASWFGHWNHSERVV